MKRRPALIELSREHHGALVWAKRLASAASDLERQALRSEITERFARELTPHFLLEENKLLPRLHDIGADGLVSRTLAEHRQLHQLADRARQGDDSALASLGVTLAAHVRFEERELFPFAEQHLDANWLDALLA